MSITNLSLINRPNEISYNGDSLDVEVNSQYLEINAYQFDGGEEGGSSVNLSCEINEELLQKLELITKAVKNKLKEKNELKTETEKTLKENGFQLKNNNWVKGNLEFYVFYNDDNGKGYVSIYDAINLNRHKTNPKINPNFNLDKFLKTL